MRKIYLFLLAVLLLPAISFPLTPQAGGATGEMHTLSWNECVRLAAQHNPVLQSALQAVAAGRAQYYGSYNGVLPSLSLTHSYTDSNTSGVGSSAGGGTTSVTTKSELWQAEGTVSMNLFNPNAWANIQSASALYRQNQANLGVSASTVLLNLYQAFTGLLYAQEEIQVNTLIRDTWKQDAQMIALRYNSGTESKGDNMHAQAQLLQAELNLVQAGRDVLIAQQNLGQVFGDDHFQAYSVTGTWATGNLSSNPNFDMLTAAHPAVQAQEAVVAQARAGLNSARSTLFPTLSVNYSKGYQDTSEFPANPYWIFSGAVNYPLFGGGLTQTYFAVSAARSTLSKAEEDLASIRLQTRSGLVSTWQGLAQARDQVKIQQAFLEAAEQRKLEYDVLYQSGLQNFEEWLLVVQDFVNSQTSFLKSEQNLILAEAQWRFAAGEPLGD
jgi:outer membrane protein TolC